MVSLKALSCLACLKYTVSKTLLRFISRNAPVFPSSVI